MQKPSVFDENTSVHSLFHFSFTSLSKTKSSIRLSKAFMISIFSALFQIKKPIQKRKCFLFLLDTCFHQSLYTTSGFADFWKRWFCLWIFFNSFFHINLKIHQRSQMFFVLHENFISFLDGKVTCWIIINLSIVSQAFFLRRLQPINGCFFSDFSYFTFS